jgi:hypothetical protein
MNGQGERRRGDLRDGNDRRDRIERGLVRRARGREAAGDHHDGVAVGHRARGLLHADQPAGAAAVIDDELPPHVLGELVSDETPHDVRATAWREGHDDAHRLGRILLRARCCARRCCRDAERDDQISLAVHVTSCGKIRRLRAARRLNNWSLAKRALTNR